MTIVADTHPVRARLRGLWPALAVSLLLHLLLFWPTARPPATAPAAGAAGHAQLQARVTAVAAPVAPLAVFESAPLPAAAGERPPEPPQPPERTYPQAGPPGQTMVPGGDAAPTGNVDLVALRAYHRVLSQTAASFRRYPPEVLASGRAGRVAMRLTLAAGGRPESLQLLAGSGMAALDRAALEMVRLAAGHTPVPPELQGQAFAIDLAVDFTPDAQSSPEKETPQE